MSGFSWVAALGVNQVVGAAYCSVLLTASVIIINLTQGETTPLVP